MAKKTKESVPMSLRMEKETFERLNSFCEDSGQTKTTAIERAINRYIDEYDRMREYNTNGSLRKKS